MSTSFKTDNFVCKTCQSRSNNILEIDDTENYLELESYSRSEDDETDLECIAYLQKNLTDPDEHTFIEGLIDHKLVSYPFCIVFIPFPLLSWLFPLVGHYGIGMSDGVIRDFSQNYEIGINTISYGLPTKYCRLYPSMAKGGGQGWDRAISIATNDYLKRRNKPVSVFRTKNPCFIAESLNHMKYQNYGQWTRCSVFFLMTNHGKYTDLCGFLRTWLPFFILISIFLFLLYAMSRVSPQVPHKN